ncbi:MAG: ribonuclease P protein subunit [Candidatus Woesearchaeota archaeon]
MIGKKIKILESTQKNIVGISGTIKDETKYTFVLDSGKRILKKSCIFQIGDEKVHGSSLTKQTYERIK